MPRHRRRELREPFGCRVDRKEYVKKPPGTSMPPGTQRQLSKCRFQQVRNAVAAISTPLRSGPRLSERGREVLDLSVRQFPRNQRTRRDSEARRIFITVDLSTSSYDTACIVRPGVKIQEPVPSPATVPQAYELPRADSPVPRDETSRLHRAVELQAGSLRNMWRIRSDVTWI